MNATQLSAILQSLPADTEVVFEIKETDQEPDTSYGIDEIIYSQGFVALRSID